MAREGIEAKTLTLKLKTTAFEVGTPGVFEVGRGAGWTGLMAVTGVW
jgi:uncharacterized FAD-dependent dehydrogenase